MRYNVPMRDQRDMWIKRRAAELRAQHIDAEGLVWLRLRSRQLGGFRFRRQHVVGRFILDFYCAEKRVAVEIDGPTHNWEQDARRDRLLNAAGIRVVRFSNDEIYRDIDGCMGGLVHVLLERPPYVRVDGRTRMRRVGDLQQPLDPPACS
jgi:very-short-patch-repair endonuclease